jgi:hypothetical protein
VGDFCRETGREYYRNVIESTELDLGEICVTVWIVVSGIELGRIIYIERERSVIERKVLFSGEIF